MSDSNARAHTVHTPSGCLTPVVSEKGGNAKTLLQGLAIPVVLNTSPQVSTIRDRPNWEETEKHLKELGAEVVTTDDKLPDALSEEMLTDAGQGVSWVVPLACRPLTKSPHAVPVAHEILVSILVCLVCDHSFPLPPPPPAAPPSVNLHRVCRSPRPQARPQLCERPLSTGPGQVTGARRNTGGLVRLASAGRHLLLTRLPPQHTMESVRGHACLGSTVYTHKVTHTKSQSQQCCSTLGQGRMCALSSDQ
jgi:hypothetical protein